MKKFNYENKIYLSKLNALEVGFYTKYIDAVEKYSTAKKNKILDVGCGNGKCLVELKKKGFENLYGVDVSSLFINNTKKKGIKNTYKYDGTNLPFKDNFFDIIGSFNVLEHTEEPEKYLKEEIKKLKKGGFLIVACPNFHTPILRTNHRRINGVTNRVLNTLRTISQLIFGGKDKFERIAPVVREDFQYDDDSIVVTNPIDLKKILHKNKCKMVYESGFINKDSVVSNLIDKLPVLRYFMPSCFVVVQKK